VFTAPPMEYLRKAVRGGPAAAGWVTFLRPEDGMEAPCYTLVESPLGSVLIAAGGAGLHRISFLDGGSPVTPGAGWRRDDRALEDAAAQVRAYFGGQLRRFELPLAPEGTPFQQRVWRELCAIPYGETISYGQLAGRVGNPAASRAVGAANGRNPLPIVVPCHRVIGATGHLTGFRGGVRLKAFLLDLERRHTGQPPAHGSRMHGPPLHGSQANRSLL